MAMQVDGWSMVHAFIRLDLPRVVEARDLLRPQLGTLTIADSDIVIPALPETGWPREVNFWGYYKEFYGVADSEVGTVELMRYTAHSLIALQVTGDEVLVELDPTAVNSCLSWEPVSREVFARPGGSRSCSNEVRPA